MSMKTRNFSVLRLTLASLCSLTLAVHGQTAQASEPEPANDVSPAEATDELPARAQEHVVKGLQQFEGGAYGNAEEEFRRAAFFAPKWRSLHFNLGVVAEAQGKLGTALSEYKSFKPFASADEGMVVDQRILELNDRHKRIARGYKSQIGTSAIAMSLGVLLLGGGGTLIGLTVRNSNQIAANKTEMAGLNLDGTNSLDAMRNTELTGQNTALTAQKSKFMYGAYFGLLIGLLVFAYSFVPLSKAIKSKRQLEGITLGPTRLQWNGGAGVRLRF